MATNGGFVSALNIENIESKLKIERIMLNITGFYELKTGKKTKGTKTEKSLHNFKQSI